MKTKLTVTAAITLLAILCVGLMAQVSAQTYVAGVKYDDYWQYSIVTHWESSNSSLSIPIQLADLNNTVYYNVTVSAVTDYVNVTARTTQRFANESEDNRLVTFDVASGTNYGFMTGFQGIVAANLNAGDKLLPTANETESDSLRINQTISRDYTSGKRDTNEVIFSYAVQTLDNSTTGTTTETLRFDKATGVLVQRIDYTEFPDQTGSIEWNMVDTNMWTVSGNPYGLPLPLPILAGIIAVVAVVVVAVVAVVARGRGKGKRKKSLR